MKIVTLFALTLLAAGHVHASSIVIVFDNPDQAGTPGETLQFFGTILNTSSDPNPVYLNSDSLNISLRASSYTAADQFFNNVPISLAGGDSSGDIDLFDIVLSRPVNDLPGLYTGRYTLLGGMDGGDGTAGDDLAESAFDVILSPEPATFLLLAAGLALTGWAGRRVKRYSTVIFPRYSP